MRHQATALLSGPLKGALVELSEAQGESLTIILAAGLMAILGQSEDDQRLWVKAAKDAMKEDNRENPKD